MKAKCHERLGQWDRAAADYTKALALAPEDTKLLELRAMAYLRAGRWREAVADCTRYLERNKEPTGLWFTRAAARIELEQWDGAAADFERGLGQAAVTDSPELLVFWQVLAAVHLKREDHAGYRSACRKMLDLCSAPGKHDPTFAVWTCSLIPLEGVDRDRPLALAEKLAGAKPRDYGALRIHGAALLRAGKLAEALTALDKANALRKEAPSIWLLLAITHARAGQRDKARPWLARAVQWHDQARKQKRGDPVAKDKIAWHQLPWAEQFAIQLLRDEAEALVGK